MCCRGRGILYGMSRWICRGRCTQTLVPCTERDNTVTEFPNFLLPKARHTVQLSLIEGANLHQLIEGFIGKDTKGWAIQRSGSLETIRLGRDRGSVGGSRIHRQQSFFLESFPQFGIRLAMARLDNSTTTWRRGRLERRTHPRWELP